MLAVFFFTLFYVKSTIITVESSELQCKSQITLIHICIHMRVKERDIQISTKSWQSSIVTRNCEDIIMPNHPWHLTLHLPTHFLQLYHPALHPLYVLFQIFILFRDTLCIINVIVQNHLATACSWTLIIQLLWYFWLLRYKRLNRDPRRDSRILCKLFTHFKAQLLIVKAST